MALVVLTQTTPAGNKASEPMPERKRRVLIVDDQPEICGMVSMILRQAGWIVDEATSGEDALTLMEDRDASLELALIDMILPGMDGSCLARRLRELRPGIGIVLLSGILEDEMRQVISPEGFRFLPKPFTLMELIEVVRLSAAGEAGADAA